MILRKTDLIVPGFLPWMTKGQIRLTTKTPRRPKKWPMIKPAAPPRANGPTKGRPCASEIFGFSLAEIAELKILWQAKSRDSYGISFITHVSHIVKAYIFDLELDTEPKLKADRHDLLTLVHPKRGLKRQRSSLSSNVISMVATKMAVNDGCAAINHDTIALYKRRIVESPVITTDMRLAAREVWLLGAFNRSHRMGGAHADLPLRLLTSHVFQLLKGTLGFEPTVWIDESRSNEIDGLPWVPWEVRLIYDLHCIAMERLQKARGLKTDIHRQADSAQDDRQREFRQIVGRIRDAWRSMRENQETFEKTAPRPAGDACRAYNVLWRFLPDTRAVVIAEWNLWALAISVAEVRWDALRRHLKRIP